MKRLSLLLLLVVLAPASASGDAPASYGKDVRVAHIRGALVAVAGTPPAELEKQIDHARTLARGTCSAGAQRLRVECLMVAMDHYCRDHAGGDAPRCRLTMDVVVSNVLADERLIPPEQRYRIMRDNKDYRRALARELRRIQGALAVDFRLRMGDAEDPAALAPNIDRYCVASADETNLPYQTCVSSLVWFIEVPLVDGKPKVDR